MEESLIVFPFRKLRHYKYLILEVMMYVKHIASCKFMYTLNKEMRAFLENNIVIIQNGFIN